MTIPSSILLLLALGATTPAWSQDSWLDREGNAVPDSDSRKSSKGFAAMLVKTSDADWREKWDTSPETVPSFSGGDDPIHDGDRLFFLPMLSNPGTDLEGKADVRCDLKMTRPDETVSIEIRDSPCFQHPLRGGAHNLYLSELIPAFLVEPTDVRGKWTVSMTLRDAVRGAEVTLVSTFVVE